MTKHIVARTKLEGEVPQMNLSLTMKRRDMMRRNSADLLA